ncbi:N-acyl homoserine lactonase family protein [Bifidobacterium simiarum]|uniref:N-acyl homoserine lactonase family protein n=1 Tax=Bifidobacterium simiarum TaxID=2045441 RepID=UPI001BDDB980|nr:N-acyl homoserine lactonase family protein [Bifidobacterium simiarum]MBT1166896.1 N-acyl homoserine lactonase family protein [Bifidobacterium simiarum]
MTNNSANNSAISIQVMVAGRVRVSPDLPFGNGCGLVRGSGFFVPASKRIWLPVCAFLVTTPHGCILFDTGWGRDMSPDGVYDRGAQIRSLGSWSLYRVNQGVVGTGMTVPEQLAAQGLSPADLDVVAISHLDCDHANGLRGVRNARRIMVSRDEMRCATRFPNSLVRFNASWWRGIDLDLYDWNGHEGPAGRSYDLFGDRSVQLINIPGHTDGQVAMKITAPSGRYVLLFADGGYATRSWRDMVTSGIVYDRHAQRSSLEWIREQSLSPLCVRSIACHDTANRPETILLS